MNQEVSLDVDQNTLLDDFKTTTDYIFSIDGGAVS